VLVVGAIALAGCGSSTPHAATGTVKLHAATSRSQLSDQSQTIARRMQSSSALAGQLRKGYHDSKISVYEVDCSEVTTGNPYSYNCGVYYNSATDQGSDGSTSIGFTATCNKAADCSWRTDLLPGQS
jgi:hypothetical protein